MLSRRFLLQQCSTVAVAGCCLSRLASAQAAGPETVGAWSGPFDGPPTVSIHLSLLPSSNEFAARLLSWRGTEQNPATGQASGYTESYVMEIPTDQGLLSTAILVENNATGLFCGGHTFLPDGTLIAMGGQINQYFFGAQEINYFQFAPTYQWVKQPTLMNSGRWYPSLCTLPNGDVVVMSGTVNTAGSRNPLPQVWETSKGGGTRNLTNAILSMSLYPKIFVAPDGRVISIGPDDVTMFLDTSGLGSWAIGPKTISGKRAYGIGLLYQDGKFLVAGGSPTNNAPTTNTAEVLDLNTPTPVWRSTNPMFYARRHANSTLLPDGKVLVTGGTTATEFNDISGVVMAAEMWDPVTEAWTLLASAQVPRMYHSTAVLLPDGRVLSAGGTFKKGQNGGNKNKNFEIFSPPYLFRGPRPTVGSVPSVAALGSGFAIGTPEAADIRQVNLVRIGSVTHTFNMNQRFVPLAIAPVEGGVWAQLPSDANRLLPGHYLLFLLNSAGVPSVGRMLQIT